MPGRSSMRSGSGPMLVALPASDDEAAVEAEEAEVEAEEAEDEAAAAAGAGCGGAPRRMLGRKRQGCCEGAPPPSALCLPRGGPDGGSVHDDALDPKEEADPCRWC